MKETTMPDLIFSALLVAMFPPIIALAVHISKPICALSKS